MEKFIKSFVFIFLITILSNATVHAKSNFIVYGVRSERLITSYYFLSLEANCDSKDALVFYNNQKKDLNVFATPPTVNSPVYYCLNAVAVPLTAKTSLTGILNWYGTNATGGTSSITAPTPSTVTVGTTSYYVSETVAGVESTRSKIDVNVVADNGALILNFRCDPSQILPADKTSSVFFDWSNNPLISNSYNYTYTIQGGSPVTGNTSVSHVQVFNMLPGQSATLTLSSATHPCVLSKTITCNVPCGTATVTPNFSAVPTSYCTNEATTNLPTSSQNVPAIAGTWDVLKVNTAVAGTKNYIFTPDPILFPCALKKILNVTVGSVVPNFSNFSICSGKPAPNLSTTSPNGISGTWSPMTINNTTSATYVFTPNPGQMCAPTAISINVTVNPSNAITNLKWTVTDAFTKNQIITITDPVGGNYLYQLDDGPIQANTVFENVSLGTHSITVKDLNGCNEFTNGNVLVINYPKFFTPNNDGFNDTWNVFTLQEQLNSKIQIFDRHGKFLKEIFPNGTGWDGTYIGQPMPANDYWFSIVYVEQDVVKNFKSHFSLKR
jgi:gliding motility-associated-like protein